jgi:hypothetical protein
MVASRLLALSSHATIAASAFTRLVFSLRWEGPTRRIRPSATRRLHARFTRARASPRARAVGFGHSLKARDPEPSKGRAAGARL